MLSEFLLGSLTANELNQFESSGLSFIKKIKLKNKGFKRFMAKV